MAATPSDLFDQKKMRFSIDLPPAEYRRLCREWIRRREARGQLTLPFARDIPTQRTAHITAESA